MKVICDRGALLDAVNLVAAVVPTRTPTPQLGCVKLSASTSGEAGELLLTGSDGETSMRLTLTHVEVVEPGDAVIPADKLKQIVGAEEGEPTLTIETDGQMCTIRGQDAIFRVFSYAASEFPEPPQLEKVVASTGADAARTVMSMPAGPLMACISRTVFATARETSRYAINGVLMKRDGKKLEMVATDGRRLALSRAAVPGKGDGGEPVTCIIPTKALNLVMRLIRDEEDRIRIAITPTMIFFGIDHPGAKDDDTPRAVLSSKLVEGTFPPFEDVIPKEQDKRITASRDELSLAVKKAAVLTNEESRGVRMNFSSSEKKLTLSSRAPEMGDAEISVSLTEFTGDDIEISFNPNFITDVLKVVNDVDVIVELKAHNKPGLIRSSDGNFTYVVMPVNLPQ